MPAKHEANVSVRMEDDGLPLPSYDWAIEPQGLDPNVMTARTLFSDTQPLLVARVLNNSTRDKTLSANSFLSMAEPVLCLSGTDCDPASMSTDGNSPFCASQLFKEPPLPATSSLSLDPVLADGTVRLASSVTSATVDAEASGSLVPFSEGQLDHIESLLRSLPDDLTLDQKHRAEEFIRARTNVFSCSKFGINCTHTKSLNTSVGPRLTLFQQLLDAAAIARGFADVPVYGLGGSCDSWRQRQFDAMPRFVAVVSDTPIPHHFAS